MKGKVRTGKKCEKGKRKRGRGRVGKQRRHYVTEKCKEWRIKGMDAYFSFS